MSPWGESHRDAFIGQLGFAGDANAASADEAPCIIGRCLVRGGIWSMFQAECDDPLLKRGIKAGSSRVWAICPRLWEKDWGGRGVLSKEGKSMNDLTVAEGEQMKE